MADAIAENYVLFIMSKRGTRPCSVIFDGYESSPKDHEHCRRNGGAGSARIRIFPSKSCPGPKTKFLLNTNSDNKEEFILFLATKINNTCGIDATVANNDCDTMIVDYVISLSATKSVDVVAEDTDVFIMLIHHVSAMSKRVCFISQNQSYDVKVIQNSMCATENARLLFIYEFTGCDTVSSIYGHGKVALFNKLGTSEVLQSIFDVLLNEQSDIDSVVAEGIKLMQFIFGKLNRALTDARINKYNSMLAKNNLSPERLPPANAFKWGSEAAYFASFFTIQRLGSININV